MQIETTLNVSDDVLFGNIFENSRKSFKWVKEIPKHDGHAVIVGGGPSVSDWINEIRSRKAMGQTIFALNGAAEMLYNLGIEVDHLVVVDARHVNVKFLGYAKHDYLSSQCHPALFERTGNATLWHQQYPDDMERFDACLPEYPDEYALVGGGTSVGLSAMALAHILGYRMLHLYGFDSSYKDGQTHAYEQSDPQCVDCDVTVAGRTFRTSLSMAQQAEQFVKLSDMLLDDGSFITIRGDGLLPWTSQMSAVKPEPMAEQDKYKRMWDIPDYRNVSPGEIVAPIACLRMDIRPSDHVLDFGCGTGRGGWRIALYRQCDVTLLDFAENCLDAEVKDSIGPRFTFRQADLTRPIPASGTKGFCADVMEHIEPEQVDAVLEHITACVDQCFFQISLVPDNMGALIGQPLHLSVHPHGWWVGKLSKFGRVLWSADYGDHALFHLSTT
jgi:SAM-dependent methyltransferase